MKITKENYKEVLTNFINFLDNQDEESIQIFIEDIDTMLDNILHDDGFGTEGQLDPRGDGRDYT